MNIRNTVFLLVINLIFGLHVFAQEKQSVEVAVKSKESIKPIKSDVGTVDTRINLRVKNVGQKEVFIFGSKFEKQFNPLFYLLTFENQSRNWVYPTWNQKPIEWEKESNMYKETLSLKAGDSFDFHILLSERQQLKKLRLALFYGFSKSVNPLIVQSEEFSRNID